MTKIIEASYRDWKPARKKLHAPNLENEINEDVIVIDKEHQTIVAIQITLSDDKKPLSKEVEKILRHSMKWDNGGVSRLSGIIASNRVFGTLAPEKLRKRYGCSTAKLNEEQPTLNKLLLEIAKYSFELFASIDPHRAESHTEIVNSQVHPDWLLGGTPFTSGIINNWSALPYHKDSGNFTGSWSMMLSLRKNLEGGHLHLPEYDLVLGVPNNSLLIFNGQELWHGVTPLIPKKKDAYRFTIVWYAKNKIKQCGCREEETQRSAIEASKP